MTMPTDYLCALLAEGRVGHIQILADSTEEATRMIDTLRPGAKFVCELADRRTENGCEWQQGAVSFHRLLIVVSTPTVQVVVKADGVAA